MVDDSLWAYHEPNNFGVGEDCTDVNASGHLIDISCSEKQCTLCNLSSRPEFELRGFCDSEPLGMKSYMDVDDRGLGVYDIIGWRGSSLIWNPETMIWEFIEVHNGNVVAFCNDSIGQYPFGVQR